MIIHTRTKLVAQARNELGDFICKLSDKYDLTTIELLQCLNEVTSTELKYALRAERHPDAPDKPADLE